MLVHEHRNLYFKVAVWLMGLSEHSSIDSVASGSIDSVASGSIIRVSISIYYILILVWMENPDTLVIKKLI